MKSAVAKLLQPQLWIESMPTFVFAGRENVEHYSIPLKRLVLVQNLNHSSGEMEDVIALAKAGDADAFWTIVLRIHDQLHTFCRSRSYGHPEYTDVVTNVLLEFRQKLPSFKETTLSGVLSHLWFIARFRCIDAHRDRQRLRQLPVDPDGQSMDPVGDDQPAGFDLEVADEWKSIVKCLKAKKISDEFIKTWWLKKMEDKSYRELANMFGIAEGAVGSRISRTSEAIKGCVEGVKS